MTLKCIQSVTITPSFPWGLTNINNARQHLDRPKSRPYSTEKGGEETRRTPWWQHARLRVLIDATKLVRSNTSGQDNLIDVFVEPVIGHDKVSVVTSGVAPAILDLEAHGFSLFVQVDSGDDL